MSSLHSFSKSATPVLFAPTTLCPLAPCGKTVPPVPDSQLLFDNPDLHLVVSDSQGKMVARASLWWSTTPLLNGTRTGFIGHFAASGPAFAHELLSRCCALLASRGAGIAIGPVDGSTWKSYRLITLRGDEPLFFGEPDSPDIHSLYFCESGFSVLADYYSTVSCNLPGKTSEPPRTIGHPEIISLKEVEPEAGLEAIFAISCVAFRSNFLYSPVDYPQFKRMYEPLVKSINPELVLLSFEKDQPTGFILGLTGGNSAPGTLIVKTAARLPERRFAGTGRLLLHELQRRAADRGYVRSIQALMHESNSSLVISRGNSRIIRRYSLFSRTL